MMFNQPNSSNIEWVNEQIKDGLQMLIKYSTLEDENAIKRQFYSGPFHLFFMIQLMVRTQCIDSLPVFCTLHVLIFALQK